MITHTSLLNTILFDQSSDSSNYCMLKLKNQLKSNNIIFTLNLSNY